MQERTCTEPMQHVTCSAHVRTTRTPGSSDDGQTDTSDAVSPGHPYLVTLNILSKRNARRTLTPNDVSALNSDQITSNMLPTITLNNAQ